LLAYTDANFGGLWLTDGQVNRLVYELYGFTEEEIAVVEGAVNGL